MKIAVNTRLLRKDSLDGIGWFTYNTLRNMVAAHPETEFHFFFDRKPDPSFLFGPNVVAHVLWPPSRHALLHFIWFEWSVKKKLKALKPDLFLSPDGMLCMGWKGKQLAVIHDINFKHNPRALKFSNRVYYNTLFPRFARIATRIATVSAFSKQDIAGSYHIDPQKIDVVYNGINSFYHPVPDDQKQNIRDRYAKGQSYFIFIGSISPRKNIAGLMKAFDHYRAHHNSSTHLLIVGGGLYKKNEYLKLKGQLRHGSAIHFTGRLPDKELNEVLGAALALVYVPLFEGFGIPLIEAMQCGVPVISSNTSSMPEVAGAAALLVDPCDTNAISEAMAKMEIDPSLRNILIEKGYQQKNKFSWEETATAVWQSMMRCL
jgi:glycosyltransferase involved in cell wall biosynthesis